MQRVVAVTESFEYEPVSAIPPKLQPGVLYHSARHQLAAHLCACGCGREVVTGLRPERWTLDVIDGAPSLTPSVGNGSFPCRSHYFITQGRVRWAGLYTDRMIALARRRDNPRAHSAQRSLWRRAVAVVRRFLRLSGDPR
jgi:hypothetical protein